MDLFNKFKNKDFLYLTNIINYNLYENSKLQDVMNNLKNFGTFEEVIDYIKNNNNIFKVNESNLIPKYEEEVPILLSYHERAWLYYVLNDEKARLFLSDENIKKLKNALERQNNNKPYPISCNSVYINKLNDKPPHHYTDEEIDNFKKLVEAVEEHKYITIENHAFTGKIYENSKLIPYKIEYNYKQDTFSVTCLNDIENKIIRVFFFNIKKIEINEKIENYNDIQAAIETLLEQKRANTPITIKILNNQNAFHRCSYAFSNYDKKTYKKDDFIFMDIKYYDFQLNDIITNIMQMGKFIQVISPVEIVEKIKDKIKAKALKYGITS